MGKLGDLELLGGWGGNGSTGNGFAKFPLNFDCASGRHFFVNNYGSARAIYDVLLTNGNSADRTVHRINRWKPNSGTESGAGLILTFRVTYLLFASHLFTFAATRTIPNAVCRPLFVPLWDAAFW